MSHVMSMNEYRLTSSHLVTKMAGDNDTMLAVASTIIAAAAVRRRRRRKRSSWMRDWMLRRPQYRTYAALLTDIRLNDLLHDVLATVNRTVCDKVTRPNSEITQLRSCPGES